MIWLAIAGLVLLAAIALFTMLRYKAKQSATAKEASGALGLDQVQFTVYRPKVLKPGIWDDLLLHAHLTAAAVQERRKQGINEPVEDPVAESERRVKASLGKKSAGFMHTSQEAKRPVRQGAELRIVPQVPGITFNPESVAFAWEETFHEVRFRMMASETLNGTSVTGAVRVFYGRVLLAEIVLNLRIDSSAETISCNATRERLHGKVFKKIFASYSHEDEAIVENFERLHRATGDRYLRDHIDLRAGQIWREELKRMIEEADVFQLFWSSRSMRSPFVREEWEYALSLNRTDFILPTYWELPLPTSQEEGLPPQELTQLHFVYVGDEAPAPHPEANPAVEPPSHSEARETTSQESEVRIGRYAITSQLGQGAFGSVFRAQDLDLDRTVLLKLVDTEGAQSRVAQLRRAAGALSRISSHPNCARIVDCGEHSGKSYLVYEYIEGKTCADLLRERPQGLEAHRALLIVAQIADALEFAHDHGCLHTNITCAEIMIDAETEAAKLLGFDLDILSSEPGTIRGTPRYMSPEQASGVTLDARSDVYSLGVVLYELLTGRVPVERGSVMEILDAVRAGKQVSIGERCRDLAPAVVVLVDKATSFNREDRFASAAQFGRACREVLNQFEHAATPQFSPKSTDTKRSKLTSLTFALFAILALMLFTLHLCSASKTPSATSGTLKTPASSTSSTPQKALPKNQ